MKKIGDFGLDLVYQKSLPMKHTARCPEQHIFRDNEGNLYCVVYGYTPVQRFYIERSVEMQKQFCEQRIPEIKCNLPLYYKEHNDGIYVVYKYFKDPIETKRAVIDEILRKYYEESEQYSVNIELVSRIEEEFLSAWPNEYRGTIKGLRLFKDFHESLLGYTEIKICFQHGDFTPNNLLTVNETLYAVDFEFSQKFQPIGFDLYDYHYSSDKVFDNIPYVELNDIKERLANTINQMIDKDYTPKVVENADCISDWADDIIYNSPSIFNRNNSYDIYISYGNIPYRVSYSKEGYKVNLCVWLRQIPEVVIEKVVRSIFEQNRTVFKIDIQYSNINIWNQLEVDNNWVIFLPKDPNEILLRLKNKGRYNLKRSQRLLEENSGPLNFIEYMNEIPESIVRKFFNWKKDTHGKDYGMSSKDYIERFHVNGAMVLMSGHVMTAVLFYSYNRHTVYFENISYDSCFKKFSPGSILYEHFLEKMTIDKMRVVVLGNGSQPYKSRYESEEHLVFTGSIYRNPLFRFINKFMRRIR